MHFKYLYFKRLYPKDGHFLPQDHDRIGRESVKTVFYKIVTALDLSAFQRTFPVSRSERDSASQTQKILQQRTMKMQDECTDITGDGKDEQNIERTHHVLVLVWGLRNTVLLEPQSGKSCEQITESESE